VFASLIEIGFKYQMLNPIHARAFWAYCLIAVHMTLYYIHGLSAYNTLTIASWS